MVIANRGHWLRGSWFVDAVAVMLTALRRMGHAVLDRSSY